MLVQRARSVNWWHCPSWFSSSRSPCLAVSTSSKGWATAAGAAIEKGAPPGIPGGSLQPLNTNALVSASDVLKLYASRQHELQLDEVVVLLRHVEGLGASVNDDRLCSLVRHLLARKEELPLSALVDVSKGMQGLGFHKELAGLTSLVADSASFLPSDVVMSLSKTLAVSARQAPGAVSPEARSGVFRVLGEHISETMFDASPQDLADALLAVASFYCSRHSGAPDPAISKPWHPVVFSSCAHALIGNVDSLPPRAMVKCLRAYSLMLLAGPRPAIESEEDADRGPLEMLPFAICGALVGRLGEIPARDMVRSLHALASLYRHGLGLGGERGVGFCRDAAGEILQRADELDLQDIAYAMQALAFLSQGHGELVRSDLLEALYSEVQHHIPSMTLERALMLAKSLERVISIKRPKILLELLAAEFLRELPNVQPQQLCDIIIVYGRMRFDDPGFFRGTSHALTAKLGQCLPGPLSSALHSFAKMDVKDNRLFREAARHIVRDLVAFRPRDLALSIWAVAKTMHRDGPLITAVQEDLKRHDVSQMKPVDVSMVLWSFSRLDVGIDNDLLGSLTHYVAKFCRRFSQEGLLVTCLAFARLGFTQQPVLVELYRGIYGRLPEASDSQLAFGFVLFSTSGIHDKALVNRFLYECSQRLSRLRGQNLSNIVLACSRVTTQAMLAQPHGLRDGLRKLVFEQLDHLPRAPLLAIYLAAPSLLEFSKDDASQLMCALSGHLTQMDSGELVHCLLGAAKLELVHKPFLLPVFHHLRRLREDLDGSEVVSCIWAVHTLGFCQPKFRRTLGHMLVKRIREWSIPPRTLMDVLPALSKLQFWGRLPPSLQRGVWRLASADLRRCVTPPPRPPSLEQADDSPSGMKKFKGWRLPSIEKGMFRAGSKNSVLKHSSRVHQSGSSVVDPDRELKKERKEERELAEERGSPYGTGQSAVRDFVAMIKRL